MDKTSLGRRQAEATALGEATDEMESRGRVPCSVQGGTAARRWLAKDTAQRGPWGRETCRGRTKDTGG